MKTLIEFVAMVVFLAASIYCFAWVISVNTRMPDVHVSNATGECVKVINYDQRFDYTCENYPEKYNHVWVQ